MSTTPSAPIGVFDSGVGGLTVLRGIIRHTQINKNILFKVICNLFLSYINSLYLIYIRNFFKSGNKKSLIY